MTATLIRPETTGRLFGPIPFQADVVHYDGTLRGPGRMKRYPQMFPTEAALLRDLHNTATEQARYSEDHAPHQVEHWLWVAEAFQRDLDALQTPAVAATAIEAPATAAHNPAEELTSDDPRLEPDGNACQTCWAHIGNEIGFDGERHVRTGFTPVYIRDGRTFCAAHADAAPMFAEVTA